MPANAGSSFQRINTCQLRNSALYLCTYFKLNSTVQKQAKSAKQQT